MEDEPVPSLRWIYLYLGATMSLWASSATVVQPQSLPQRLPIARLAQAPEVVTQTSSATPASLVAIEQSVQLDAPILLSEADRDRFNQILLQAQRDSWSQLPPEQFIQRIAEQFVGARYQAGLLDGGEREALVLSLQNFDCVLFIETVLALGKGILQAEALTQENMAEPAEQWQPQKVAETTFSASVEGYRYRGGELGEYCDRLHYFSDWILDNQQRGNAIAILQLASQPLGKAITFMGSHRSSYPQLKSEDQYQCIRAAENRLNKKISGHSNNPANPLGYIPTAQIRAQYSKLQAGDIVAVATSVPGLDVTHTGLVYRHTNGNFGLIHSAPNVGVTIATDLQTYIERVDAAIGIIVTRPVL